jgi:hypothetical protein
MTRVVARSICIAVSLVVLSAAHVGSPDAWFEGPAGPYAVLVHIEAPSVIPGIAVVNVRVSADGIERVTAMGNRFDATGGAPPPEIAKPVEGQPGWYRTSLWVMTAGSNSVTVGVVGSRGTGSVVVPLVAVPIRRLAFNRGLGIVLGGLGLFLAAGLLTIIGAAVREGVLPPGEEPDRQRRQLAWRARAAAALVLGLLLFGGWRWWGAEDGVFVRSMFKPFASQASVVSDTTGRSLVLDISELAWVNRRNDTYLRLRLARHTPLIPDHGKLMHLFLVGESGATFAHLHPSTSDSVRFSAPLPPLPAGRYRVFGDIVHESGMAQTLVSNVEILPEARPPARNIRDADDSWAARDSSATGNHITLDDGTTMTWLRDATPLVAGKYASLRFVVAGSDGKPASLEPYMGMKGHAVVVRDDGKIFVHLHPLGTISMAAQMSFEMREPADSAPGRLAKRLSMDGVGLHGATARSDSPAPTDTLSFPYAFPEAGSYAVWVQAKRDGRVLTGVFRATVVARP